jgi:Aspartyl/Asparaginyl beta-hydroxylase
MWQESNFTKHGDIKISDKLKELVVTHPWENKHLWNPKFLGFENTQFIYYYFSELSGTLYKRNYNEQDLALRSETQYILDYILTIWPNYRFIKGEIAHCPPNVKQGMHVDFRVFHRFCHRVHVPITTNTQAHLKVENTKQHLAQGEIWTFNNLKLHASENLGLTGRAHIIVDIMNPEVYDKFISKYPESYLYETTDKYTIEL